MKLQLLVVFALLFSCLGFFVAVRAHLCVVAKFVG